MKCGCMWIQHNHPNTIILCMHVGIIATLNQRTAVVILGIPNKKNKSALLNFSWNVCTNIHMLQKLFSIIKSAPVRMVLRPMEHFIVAFNHINFNMQAAFLYNWRLGFKIDWTMVWPLGKYMRSIKRYGTMHNFLEKKLVQMIFWFKGRCRVKTH